MTIKVKISSAGARSILRSPAVQQDLLRRAEAIQAACGDGYEADVIPGLNRARAMVKTAGFDAARDNAKRNTLLKNLDRGRA